jgi:hypothetical protein
MLGALITFLVLFGLIKIFERNRDDLDSFQVGVVAVVPILIVVIIRVVLGLLYPQPILMMIVPPLALIGFTFFLLYKNLEIPLGRSIGYTVAVVVVNEVLALVLASS